MFHVMNATPRSSRPRLALAVLAISVTFGVIEAAQGRFQYSYVSDADFWPEAMWRTLPSWLLLAAMVPAIFWMCRVARIGAENWRLTVPLQILAGTVFALLHLVGTAVIAAYRHGAAFDAYIPSMFGRYAVYGFFTYGAVAAVLHARHYQSEAQRQAMAAAELQAGLARARLRSLQAQLQPHFLFNALHSISSLALIGERERVVKTVSSLSELLRKSLDGSAEQQVTLAAELEIVDCYLDLERVRFGDRLSVERRIEPAALDAMVPSLMLQTLVENAVRHGIEARRGPGRLVIDATCVGGELHVEVRDSGPGFGPPGATRGRGIGLANTESRLQQLHGVAARLERGGAPEGGARVTVVLPFRRATPAAAR